MSVAFSLKNISKAYGDDLLFSDLSIDFKFNEQLGIIGSNGSGKSTLLKIIAGMVSPDTGEKITRRGLRAVYLAQEDHFNPDMSVEQILYQGLQTAGVDEKDQHRIVQVILGQAGFTEKNTLFRNLSGGWKKKLAIAQALAAEPDILLLDEPTNHLDLNGVLWLENILKTARFSFILVSHDRAFLNAVCRNVMEIGRYYPGGYFKINGNYSAFKKQRSAFLTAQQKKAASLSNKMRREEEWLRQGPKARTSKAKFRIDQAMELKIRVDQINRMTRENKKIDVDFHATGRQTKKLLKSYQIKKCINDSALFSNITFSIGPGTCLGVVGDNGSGKSTLLSLFEKKMAPDSGKIEWAQDLKINVFDQTRSQLEPDQTVKDALNPAGGDSVNYRGRSIHIVSWAKRFLFMPDQLDMPVNRLSGGEKARIMLANVMQMPCDLLLLDEPTNDLDILSLEVLEQSINQFEGAVIIVSHDRYLMDRVCDQMLYLNPGEDGLFFRSFEQILKHRSQTSKKTEKIKKKSETKQRPQSDHVKTRLSYKDQYELDHIEEKILDAENEAAGYEEKIQDPDIINDLEQMSRYCSRLETAQEKVRTLYDRWEALEQKKSDAQKN